MRLVRFTVNRRNYLADKLADTANYAMVGLVFALIAVKDFDLRIIGEGLFFYLIVMAVGFILKK